MAVTDHKRTKTTLRKMLVPTAAGVAGGAAGLALTRKRGIRGAVPEMKKIGIGNLADDLREKLDTVLGKHDSSERSPGSRAVGSRVFNAGELESRRREREEHRKHRRQRSRA